MKKWVVEIKGEPHVCNLIRAYPYTKQLMLEYEGKEFFINFEQTEDYMDAKLGTRRPCYISNKNKTQYKHGFAVFKTIIKK